MTEPIIDFAAAEAVFAASVDGTVGIEEEFAIVDPSSLDLVQKFEELRDAAAADPVLTPAIAGELIASEIEITSGRAESLTEAIAFQREHRRLLFALAQEHGVALASQGTHPWADFREQPIIDTEHYRRVEDGLKYVAWRNNTFSLHVHVGVNDLDRAVKVCDRLRPVLPLLLALSANSVCVDARDSGLHSTRTQIFTKSFPRCGVPDVFGSWAAFKDYLELLVQTSSIVEYTQVWFSVRPHLAFGTVEVRICDAQTSVAESEALAGLIAACVGQAARDIDDGVPFEHPEGRLVEENMWRAIRFGLDGAMIDPATRTTYPAATIADRLLEWTAPIRAERAIDPMLPERNGAQRQRTLLDGGASLEDAYSHAVKETRETYAQEVRA